MPASCDLDLLTLKLVFESRVTWATCANFSLPRSLCSRLRPDVRGRRQTDGRQTASSLNAPPIRGGGIKTPANPGSHGNGRKNGERFPNKLLWFGSGEYLGLCVNEMTSNELA